MKGLAELASMVGSILVGDAPRVFTDRSAWATEFIKGMRRRRARGWQAKRARLRQQRYHRKLNAGTKGRTKR